MQIDITSEIFATSGEERVSSRVDSVSRAARVGLTSVTDWFPLTMKKLNIFRTHGNLNGKILQEDLEEEVSHEAAEVKNGGSFL